MVRASAINRFNEGEKWDVSNNGKSRDTADPVSLVVDHCENTTFVLLLEVIKAPNGRQKIKDLLL